MKWIKNALTKFPTPLKMQQKYGRNFQEKDDKIQTSVNLKCHYNWLSIMN
jgi:hypothetical protein